MDCGKFMITLLQLPIALCHACKQFYSIVHTASRGDSNHYSCREHVSVPPILLMDLIIVISYLSYRQSVVESKQ